MACTLEIKKAIERSIDEIIPDRSAVMSLNAANALKRKVNELWGVPTLIKAVQYSGDGGYKLVVNPAGLSEAVSIENTKQLAAEQQFERDLDFFQGDEALLEQEERDNALLQKEGTETTAASPATIKMLKDFLSRIGVSIKNVDEIVINGIKKDATGAALLTQKLVQVVNGKEETALPEEAMHWAVEIIKQKDPALFQKLLKEINDYETYKQVLRTYGTDPDYQNKEGKPDIIKLKTEAIGKVLAETIIGKAEKIETSSAKVEKAQSWWEQIIAALRKLFSTSGFNELSMKIIAGEDIGTADDVTTEGVLYQKDTRSGMDKVNAFFTKVMDISNSMRLIDTDPNDRHYTRNGRRIKTSVTKWIKRKSAETFVRTDAQKIIDNQKQYWGSNGHKYFEDVLLNSYIDENGYKRDTPLPYSSSAPLSPDVKEVLDEFIVKLMGSYPEGTRFIIEKYVHNEKKDVASTIDFMAIVPKEDDFVVDVLDWKFTTIDLDVTNDVPWFKQEEYKLQMTEYSEILQRYGLKPRQLRKSMMVPIKANYEHVIPDDTRTPLYLESIEIADLDNLGEMIEYLLPVPLDSQSTGNKHLDKFILALREQYSKFIKRVVSPEQQYIKDQQREELALAIRKLHLQLDFLPMAKIGNTFVKNARANLTALSDKDYKTMSLQGMTTVLKELNYITNGAKKYDEAAEVYLTVNKGKTLSDEEKFVLGELERLKTRTESVLEDTLNLRRLYVAQLAVNYGITSEDPEKSLESFLKGEFIQSGSILNPEREVGNYDRMMTETSSLDVRSAKLIQRIREIARSTADFNIAAQTREFGRLLLEVEKEAAIRGKSAFELIATIKENGKISYIEKLNPVFKSEMREAQLKRNRKFFLENVNKDKYNALANEYVRVSTEAIDSNPNLSDEDKARKISQIKNKVLLERESFNGFNNSTFTKFFWEAVDDEKNASKEYLNMSPAALNLWRFIVEGLNETARDLGYIGGANRSFFALMDATILQKFTDVKGLGGQFKDFFKDQYTVRVNEEQNAAKVDKETGKIKRENPKYFTVTDRVESQLSKDLTKVVPMWIKAVNEYKMRADLEDVFLAVLEVEKSKSNLMVAPGGELMDDGGEVRTTSENRNVELLEAIVDDYLYDITESENSITNKYIKLGFDKTQGTEEDKERRKLGTKKVIRSLTTWTQMLGTGLKLAVGIPNWFGQMFQSYINSGNFYRFREFMRNHGRIMIPGAVKGNELGLLDLIIPLNEDVATEERRKIAWKQSPLKWLSTWTFNDIMMVTSAFPERRLQYANAMSFNENSMVADGKIVQIRQYLMDQDRAVKYDMSEQERKALEKSFESRVKELKDTKSLLKIAEVQDDVVVIPGVSEEEIAKYRIKIRDFSRNMSGQMSMDDKPGYTRDTMARAFMMFKGWIPKQLAVRGKNITYNVKQEQWEYGRTRLFAKTLLHLGTRAFTNINDIMTGTDKGLQIMQEMLEQKREEYFERTGEELQITDEQFYEMMRKAVRDQFREIQVVLLTLAIYFAASRYGDDDDEMDAAEKNKWKFIAKIAYKVSEEVNFYYNPLSLDGFTNGNLIPGMTIAAKAMKIITTGSKEIIGTATGDEEMTEKAHFQKAVFDIIPGPSQFQKEFLPICCPDVAKEMGIRVTAEVQRR